MEINNTHISLGVEPDPCSITSKA